MSWAAGGVDPSSCAVGAIHLSNDINSYLERQLQYQRFIIKVALYIFLKLAFNLVFHSV